MEQNSLVEIIGEQTKRALWEVKNVIDCIPDDYWNTIYCEIPMWIYSDLGLEAKLILNLNSHA